MTFILIGFILAQRLLRFKLFAPKVTKRLDINTDRLYTGAGAPKISRKTCPFAPNSSLLNLHQCRKKGSLSHWRPRADCLRKDYHIRSKLSKTLFAGGVQISIAIALAPPRRKMQPSFEMILRRGDNHLKPLWILVLQMRMNPIWGPDVSCETWFSCSAPFVFVSIPSIGFAIAYFMYHGNNYFRSVERFIGIEKISHHFSPPRAPCNFIHAPFFLCLRY